MDIGQMFISLGIKGDTKGIDNVIKRIDVLNQKVKTLDKSFKELDQSIKIKGSLGANIGRVSAGTNTARSYATLQSKTEDKAAKDQEKRMTSYQKFQEKSIKIEEREKKKEEKEQEKRRKAEDKAAKNFFKTIDNGFSNAGKTFLGFLAATGAAGFIANTASKAVTLSNLTKQFGIGPEKSQRFANVFQGANSNLNKEDVYGFLGNITQLISSGEIKGGELAGKLASVNLSPANIHSAEDLILGLRKVSSGTPFQRNIFTSLISDLGIPPDFANALNSETFSDESFDKAYNQPILKGSQIQAGEDIKVKMNELLSNLGVLQGRLNELFGPKLIGMIDKVIKKLNGLDDEDLKKGASTLEYGALGAIIGSFFGKKKMGALVGGAIGYGIESFNTNDTADEFGPSWFRIKRNGRQTKSKTSDSYIVPSFDKNQNDFMNSVDPNFYGRTSPLTEREKFGLESQTSLKSSPVINNNITTTINAASIDQNSIPALTNAFTQAGQSLLDNNSKLYSRRTQFDMGR